MAIANTLKNLPQQQSCKPSYILVVLQEDSHAYESWKVNYEFCQWPSRDSEECPITHNQVALVQS